MHGMYMSGVPDNFWSVTAKQMLIGHKLLFSNALLSLVISKLAALHTVDMHSMYFP